MHSDTNNTVIQCARPAAQFQNVNQQSSCFVGLHFSATSWNAPSSSFVRLFQSPRFALSRMSPSQRCPTSRRQTGPFPGLANVPDIPVCQRPQHNPVRQGPLPGSTERAMKRVKRKELTSKLPHIPAKDRGVSPSSDKAFGSAPARRSSLLVRQYMEEEHGRGMKNILSGRCGPGFSIDK